MKYITNSEKKKLYLKIKHEMGFPKRPFEIDEDMMDTYLENVLEDYSSIMNNWIIEQQWADLQGVPVDTNDLLKHFTTKTNSFMESFTYAYSKQVGLGTNAPAENGWELKRDFITIKAGTQIYKIPKGRQVNEVLWETPPSIDSGLVDPFALSNWSSGQFGWSYMGKPAHYIQPTYSLLATAQDRRMKQKILQSEFSYKITGLETGEKLLHLYPVPGNRYEIPDKNGKHMDGHKVWYWYYDTEDKSDEKKCTNKNSDVIKIPSDVPMDNLKWNNLNSVARTHIRNLLLAKVKIVIGGVRGFYSGELGTDAKALTLDYRHLLEEGEKLKTETEERITQSLDKLSYANLTKERAEIAENINKAMQYQPFKRPLITL